MRSTTAGGCDQIHANRTGQHVIFDRCHNSEEIDGRNETDFLPIVCLERLYALFFVEIVQKLTKFQITDTSILLFTEIEFDKFAIEIERHIDDGLSMFDDT